MNILSGVGQGGGETPSYLRICSFFKYAGFIQSRYSEIFLRSWGFTPPLMRPGWDRDQVLEYLECVKNRLKPCPTMDILMGVGQRGDEPSFFFGLPLVYSRVLKRKSLYRDLYS